MKYAVIFLLLCGVAACVTLEESGTIHGQGVHDYEASIGGHDIPGVGNNLSVSDEGIVTLENGTRLQLIEVNGTVEWAVLA